MTKQIQNYLDEAGFEKVGLQEQYDKDVVMLRVHQYKYQNGETAIGVYVNDTVEGEETIGISAIDARTGQGRQVCDPLRCLSSQPELLAAIVLELKQQGEDVRMAIKQAMSARQGGSKR